MYNGRADYITAEGWLSEHHCLAPGIDCLWLCLDRIRYMKALPWILVVILGVLLYFSINRGNVKPGVEIVTVDSIVHDTLFYPKPVLWFVDVVRYDTIPIESLVHDTVNVVIPVESKEYRDSTYQAWVSGYKASLDSIKVFPTIIYRTKIITKKEKKRFGLGVQAGYGVPHGAYIGVGVSYNILQW